MGMPGKEYTNGSEYRYGFNGKEKSDEVYGDGNVYDYGYRIYNPRIGRFLSTDPLFKSYPWYTPYQFAGNQPIWAIDLDGLEEWVVTRWYDKNNNVTQIRIFTVVETKNKAKSVNLHFKNGSGNELAKGNKVLYLHLQQGTNKVFSPPTYGSALTTDERKIYDSKKKIDPIRADQSRWTLEPAYSGYKTSENSNLSKIYTEYDAYTQFKITPPGENTTSQTQRSIPPATTTPKPLCFFCFNGTDREYEQHDKRDAKPIVDWLNTNPDYNLEISVDGGGDSWFIMDNWNDNFTDKQTYEQHTRAQFKLLQEEVTRQGGDGNRLSLKLKSAEGKDVKYTPIKKE